MRNSWGSYWGEMGFARVMMHKVQSSNSTYIHAYIHTYIHFECLSQNNLALESECDWGVPQLHKDQERLAHHTPLHSTAAAASPKQRCVQKNKVRSNIMSEFIVYAAANKYCIIMEHWNYNVLCFTSGQASSHPRGVSPPSDVHQSLRPPLDL